MGNEIIFEVDVCGKKVTELCEKPRVFFVCHSDDFDKYYKKICDDIDATDADCAIYYTKDRNKVFSEEEEEILLPRFNLFVVPVTYKLLNSPNYAMEEVKFALEKGIPVLPVMMEPGLENDYSKPEKFGDLHFFNPFDTDKTATPYETKLKNFLNSVLIDPERAKCIRAAFDAYIFLSYRKKDRAYANALMRTIHENPEFRDIAVWFDEFLIPGESFNKNIEKMMDNSKLFALLVTPRIFEKIVKKGIKSDNYVVSTELPLAQKKKQEKGTDIIAVEAEKTDRERLAEIDIKKIINSKDKEFRTRLTEEISKIATKINDTPEHNFFIGLAYLKGMNVEENRSRGVELIRGAAESGFAPAMEDLRDMYYNGDGIKRDREESIRWGERVIEHYKKESDGKDTDILAEKITGLGRWCYDIGATDKAVLWNDEAYNINLRLYGKGDCRTLMSQSSLAMSHMLKGNRKETVCLLENATKTSEEAYGEESDITLHCLSNLAFVYSWLVETEKALVHYEKVCRIRSNMYGKDHMETLIDRSYKALVECEIIEKEEEKRGETKESKAKKLELLDEQKELYDSFCKTFGKKHVQTASALGVLSDIYALNGNHLRAVKLSKEAYELYSEMFCDRNNSTLTMLFKLGTAHEKYGDYCLEKNEDQTASQNYAQAKEAYKKAYEMQREALGKTHPDTVSSLESLGGVCYKHNDSEDAIKYLNEAYVLRQSSADIPLVFLINILHNMEVCYNELIKRKVDVDNNNKELLRVLKMLYPLEEKEYGRGDKRTVETFKKINTLRKK